MAPAQAGLRLGGLRYLEALRVLIPRLVLDILHDRFLIYYAHRRAKVAPRHMCWPQYLLRKCGKSSCNWRLDFPFTYCAIFAGDNSGGADTSKWM